MTESVLTRLARGDRSAVRACIDEYGSLIWSIARRLTRTRSDAEDAVQEIFTELWRNACRFDAAKGSEKVFITTIARRRLIDRLRRAEQEIRTRDSGELESLQFAAPAAAAELCADAEVAARAVMQLRPEQRRVIELGILYGMSHSEIADALSMPVGTVKTMMRRGLMQVRELMGLRDSDGGDA